MRACKIVKLNMIPQAGFIIIMTHLFEERANGKRGTLQKTELKKQTICDIISGVVLSAEGLINLLLPHMSL